MMREILVPHHTHTDIGYTHDQPSGWELYLPGWDAVFDTMGTRTLLDIEQIPGCSTIIALPTFVCLSLVSAMES